MTGIPNADRFIRFEPITDGYSSDRKFRLETATGERFLLRVSDREEAARKDAEWRMLARATELGVPTSSPIERGACEDGESIYMLLKWCEGTDAAALLPTVPAAEQLAIGIRVGQTLRKLHAAPAPEDIEPWGDWFRCKVRLRLDALEEAQASNPALPDVSRLADHLRMHADLLDGRPQTLTHGDIHRGNIIVSPAGEVALIDFNAYNRAYGDPWWEFCAMGWGEEVNANYETGLIRGYFGAEPPEDFFALLAYYYAYDAISAVVSAHTGDEPTTLQAAHTHVAHVLEWFDDMRRTTPCWYLWPIGAESGDIA